METINLTSIKKEFTIAAAQKTAFKVFTEKCTSGGRVPTISATLDMTEIVVEPFANGRWHQTYRWHGGR